MKDTVSVSVVVGSTSRIACDGVDVGASCGVPAGVGSGCSACSGSGVGVGSSASCDSTCVRDTSRPSAVSVSVISARSCAYGSTAPL